MLVDDEVQCKLRLLCKTNETQTKTNAARLKILKYHHPLDEVIGMDWGIKPHAISWIGRDCVVFG